MLEHLNMASTQYDTNVFHSRKRSNDNFKITKYTKVCELHFKPDEIKVSIGRGIKTLIGDAVSSMYSFKNQRVELPRRKSPRKRVLLATYHYTESPRKKQRLASSEVQEGSEVIDHSVNNEIHSNCCEQCDTFKSQIKILENKLKQTENHNVFWNVFWKKNV